MEVKMENLLNDFPDLSAEEQTELLARLAKTIEAARQNVFKDKQPALTEAFFNLLEPTRRKQLEAEIHALHVTEDVDSFQAEMLLSAFHNGMQYQLSMQRLPTDAAKKTTNSAHDQQVARGSYVLSYIRVGQSGAICC